MGRYSSWWSRLLIIVVIVAIVTPIGIYAVPQLEPYLALMEFYENPENAVVLGMDFVDSDADTYGNWTWLLQRMDLQFNNPLDQKLKIPAADLSVRYLGGRLGEGYIADEYEIAPGGSEVVSLYMRIMNVGKQADLFSTFLRALFWGQDLTLNADINAYILIDGVIDEPLIGLKFPLSIQVPLPIGLHGWDPLIYDIKTGAVEENQPVEITVNASDPGSGIYYSDPTYGITGRSYIYYKVNPTGDWDRTSYDGRVELQGPQWDSEFNGLKIGGPFPISSSEPDSPISLKGNIPASVQQDGDTIEYFIYLEDYAGNWKHEKQANFFESEKLNYTVQSGPAQSPVNKPYDVEWETPFIIEYLDYIDTHGINLQHYLYTLGVDLLKLTPVLGIMSQTLYTYDIDMDYFLALLMSDFIKGIVFMGDSAVPPGVLLEILGDYFNFEFDDMVKYMLPRIWYPFEGSDNLPQLAADVLAMKSGTPAEQAKFAALKAQFNSYGITMEDMKFYIDPFGSTGILGQQREEFRSVYTIEFPPFVINLIIIQLEITIRAQGNIIRDWSYNTGLDAIPENAVYENWLELIRLGNETNAYWAAANLILKSSYAENQPARTQQVFAELLNTKLMEIPEAFPANDLYPYTHQFVSLIMLLALGIVSYLVLKREILIHRKVERGLAAKKKMTQKKVLDKAAKDKTQSKYL